jgi:hypothetical protein
MYVFKGFAENSRIPNNTPGITNPIGELSQLAATYSREKGLYAGDNAPNVNLVSFLSALDGVLVQAPVVFSTHILDVVAFVYTQILSGTEMTAPELLTQLLTKFQTTASDFQSGLIITDGRHFGPEWISWKMKGQGENNIRIWFGDESFRSRYDEFEIVVVPPLDRLDDFFKLGDEVETIINSRSYSQNVAKVNAAIGKYPQSVLRAETYNYVDPYNATHLVPTNWTVLIYGAAGNNIDSIKDALVKYILDNSTHTREEWTPILPDLFKRTEYILVPMWNQYAIPNLQVQAGIYSPIANLRRTASLMALVASAYPGSHINNYTAVLPHPYKCLAVVTVGSPENRDNKFQITDEFPDYIGVLAPDKDFNRMSEKTKRWAEMLDLLIQAAETLTEFSDIPQTFMTRLKRNGLLYIVGSYENIQYLVAAKSTLPATPA